MITTPEAGPDLRTAFVSMVALFAVDVLVEAAKDPRAVDAICTLMVRRTTPPVPVKTTALTKRELAKLIGKSPSSIDRFDREKAPHWYCGESKRYDLDAYRGWLAARGKRATKARTTERPIDISDVVAGAHLREVTR